ncbi:MAG: GatB/YqeY domain-containing protein [Yoonia sp.]
MDMRTSITAALKDAMKAKEADRLSTLRLINAAIKDRDIAKRGAGEEDTGVSDAEILAILGKMVKQRQESARAYEEGGRLELAAKELSEIKIIEDYLPRQLSDDEAETAVSAAIADIGAESLRDMGKVIAALKDKYTGQMDFSKVGPMVKSRLG